MSSLYLWNGQKYKDLALGFLGINRIWSGLGSMWCILAVLTENLAKIYMADFIIHISEPCSLSATSPQTSFQGGIRMENLCSL